MRLSVKLLTPEAILPKRGTPESAGLDLFVDLSSVSADYKSVPLIIPAFGTVKIPTGIAIAIPESFFGQIAPRSSAFLSGLNITGVIDSDYRGQIHLMIQNTTSQPKPILHGKSYAQLLVLPYHSTAVPVEVNQLNSTVRGENGFGSTGI